MKKITLILALAVFIAVSLAGCGGQSSEAKFPGTKDSAKSLLGEYMKPDADRKKLTMELRPTKEDYQAFYANETLAAQAETYYDKLWSGGDAVVAPKEGQTELKLFSATTEDLRDSKGEAADFPA